jgi:hypothetical protein
MYHFMVQGKFSLCGADDAVIHVVSETVGWEFLVHCLYVIA